MHNEFHESNPGTRFGSEGGLRGGHDYEMRRSIAMFMPPAQASPGEARQEEPDAAAYRAQRSDAQEANDSIPYHQPDNTTAESGVVIGSGGNRVITYTANRVEVSEGGEGVEQIHQLAEKARELGRAATEAGAQLRGDYEQEGLFTDDGRIFNESITGGESNRRT